MKVVNVVGARPQFIKLAPVLKAIKRQNQKYSDHPIQEILVHTGQHYDYEMSQVFFDELGLKAPDYHLGVGSGSHGYQTGEMLKRIEEVLLKEKPDLVMVYGDTNTTLAGALAAAKLHIPVAHVEAGLRSFNKKMPEEINRVLTDHLSDLLFVRLKRPWKTCVVRALKKVYICGRCDVRRSAFVSGSCREKIRNYGTPWIEAEILCPGHGSSGGKHGPAGTPEGNFEGLERVAKEGLSVILPLHPRTRKQLNALGLHPKEVQVLDPVSYLDMLVLERDARVILTDSGGVQKEAFFFRVPCVTLREETEWVETVETGWNTLVGCDPKRMVQAASEARPGIESVWPYGDGQAAEKIVSAIICDAVKRIRKS
jgi:UDP-N-acetylglucosamine 2-epimerase